MKQCPECKREYDDDSLRFCLDDGTALVRPDASPKSADPTVVLPGNEPAPTQIAEPARPDVPLAAGVRANKEIIPGSSLSPGTVRIVIAVLFVISVLGTIIGWVAWGYITFRRTPLVLLFLIVMVLVFVRAPRHPKVSLLVGLALGFDLIETGIYILINRGLQPLQATLQTSDVQMKTVYTVLAVLDDFALAAVLIVLTAAVLTGRKSISQTA